MTHVKAASDYPRAVAKLDRAIVRVLPAMPRSLVRRISDRYIAGTTIADAVRVVRELNAEGKMATVDVLGEEATGRRETLEFVRSYHDVFEAIERERLDSNVSIKLTALGLNLAYELCRANLFKVVRHAAESGNFVRIDMEDSTHDLGHARAVPRAARRGARQRRDRPAGRPAPLDPRHPRARPLRPNVRLVKGIYVEPPLIAYQEFDEVRQNFVRCLHELLQAGSYTAIATHDELLLSEGKRLVAERGLTPEQYEFQMLLGVRELAADRLVRDRHRLRIYVPFGEHRYRYSLRRLQENPKIAGYVALGHAQPAVRRGRPLKLAALLSCRWISALSGLRGRRGAT